MNEILRTQKIKIYPNKNQQELLFKSCNVSKFAWNWGLEHWKKQYEDGLKPNGRDLRNEFVKEKNSNLELSWINEVSSEAFKNSFLDLQKAWNNFFRTKKGKPKFKSKKKMKFSYTETCTKIGCLRLEGKKLYIPKFKKDNFIKTSEKQRFRGIIKQLTISYEVGYWYASLLISCKEAPNHYKLAKTYNETIGIDLGISKLVTMSNGYYYDKINLKEIDKKIKKQQRKVSRKKLNSSNRAKARIKLQKFYKKKQNIIIDTIHKITYDIVCNYKKICIEDLRSSNLMKNHKLARKIQDSHFYEFRRQLEYKSQYVNELLKNLERKEKVEITLADRLYPSTQKCCKCGHERTGKDKLKLSERIYKCLVCDNVMDRDLNASINLENLLILN